MRRIEFSSDAGKGLAKRGRRAAFEVAHSVYASVILVIVQERRALSEERSVEVAVEELKSVARLNLHCVSKQTTQLPAYIN
ncbi:hypothetical protein Tcan_03736 [Toxocara canis]|uniref:Uncharacterized protein n=1 Tax=Toxocara canis TaxID=6265 RepID=A0A0B2UXU8_TOXCA|nr:hypothetical protein Tcan_03736 [Toxocara canis]